MEKFWSHQAFPISQATSRSAKPTASMFRLEGLDDHGILVHCDIRPAGTAEIENAINRDGGFRASQITCHEAPDVFR
jgi:hypothetical protein